MWPCICVCMCMCMRPCVARLRRFPREPLPPPAFLIGPSPLPTAQLIRFLREHGQDVGKIEGGFRRALEWRYKNLPKNIPTTADPADYLSASEMPHGEWATQYAHIGLYCGLSQIGWCALAASPAATPPCHPHGRTLGTPAPRTRAAGTLLGTLTLASVRPATRHERWWHAAAHIEARTSYRPGRPSPHTAPSRSNGWGDMISRGCRSRTPTTARSSTSSTSG